MAEGVGISLTYLKHSCWRTSVCIVT